MPEGLPEIYGIVKAANQAAFEAAKPGTVCEDVDKAARSVIEKAGYGPYFTHRLGHGLGLDVHEHPYLSAGNKHVIEAGNVFSDEPGIYLPGASACALKICCSSTLKAPSASPRWTTSCA